MLSIPFFFCLVLIVGGIAMEFFMAIHHIR